MSGNISICFVVISVIGLFCGFVVSDIDCLMGVVVIYDLEEESFILMVDDCFGYLFGELFLVVIELCGDGEIIVNIVFLSSNV